MKFMKLLGHDGVKYVKIVRQMEQFIIAYCSSINNRYVCHYLYCIYNVTEVRHVKDEVKIKLIRMYKILVQSSKYYKFLELNQLLNFVKYYDTGYYVGNLLIHC